MHFKNTILFIFFLKFSGLQIYAQNLVPNPGFELMNNCTLNNFDHPIEGFISHWFSYNYNQNTVDVFHGCFNIGILQPPTTIRGYSYAHNGDGMIGLCYVKEDNYQEVISVKLDTTLIKDSAYCITFWVKNSKIEGMQYSVEYVGLLFTENIISPFEVHNNLPDVKSKSDLSKNEWIEVSGYIIATGLERFVNVGFFGSSISKTQNIPYQPGTSYTPYYFIDDVSVTMCNKDSLLSVVCELPNVLTPNQDGYNDSYELKLNNIKKLDIQVLNRWGNVVNTYDGTKYVWDGTDQSGTPLTEGIYFVKAIGETTFGELISKQQFVHLIRQI